MSKGILFYKLWIIMHPQINVEKFTNVEFTTSLMDDVRRTTSSEVLTYFDVTGNEEIVMT